MSNFQKSSKYQAGLERALPPCSHRTWSRGREQSQEVVALLGLSDMSEAWLMLSYTMAGYSRAEGLGPLCLRIIGLFLC